MIYLLDIVPQIHATQESDSLLSLAERLDLVRNDEGDLSNLETEKVSYIFNEGYHN